MAALPFGSRMQGIGGHLDPAGAGGWVDTYGIVAGPDANQMQMMNRELYDPFHWQRDQQSAQYGLAGQRLGLQQQQQKFNMLKDAWGGILGNMNYSANYRRGGNVPMPNYVGTQGVFTPGEIQNQVNLGWAQNQATAANANRGYANSMASRGFSPMSPSLAFQENVNNWRANAAAMANETQFRTGAAQSNRDATLKAQGINAQLYGDYARALAQDRQLQLTQQGQQYDLLTRLLGAMS